MTEINYVRHFGYVSPSSLMGVGAWPGQAPPPPTAQPGPLVPSGGLLDAPGGLLDAPGGLLDAPGGLAFVCLLCPGLGMVPQKCRT